MSETLPYAVKYWQHRCRIRIRERLAWSIARGFRMQRLFIAALVSVFAIGSAMAQEPTCESKAVGKDGKPLAGAAKTSFIKKCKTEACETKAVGSDGKKLAGAAKASFMKKCQAGA